MPFQNLATDFVNSSSSIKIYEEHRPLKAEVKVTNSFLKYLWQIFIFKVQFLKIRCCIMHWRMDTEKS